MTADADYETGERVYRVTLPICAACIQGVGEECHSPGCSFWMQRPPAVYFWSIERIEQVSPTDGPAA